MIINVINSLFDLIWTFLKWPLIALIIFTILEFILTSIWRIYFIKVKGMKPIEGEHYKVKEPNLFIKLFWLAPKQFAEDRLKRNPEFFRHQGLIIYTGNQGLI